jgi:hypothetical protein
MSTTEGPFGDSGGTRTGNASRGAEQQRIDQEDLHLPLNRLTRAEIEAVRELIESDRRARWLWSSLRIWASWISGTLVALYAIWDQVEKFIKKFGG